MYKIIIKKKRFREREWKRFAWETMYKWLHNCCVCLCMATCSMYVPYFLRIFLILFYVSRIIFFSFFWILIFNYYNIFFVSSLSWFFFCFNFNSLLLFVVCSFFVFDILLQGFQNCLMFTPGFLLCWVVCCNSVIIKYALNLFALNKVSHSYLFI